MVFLIDQPLDKRNRLRFALDFWSLQSDGLLVIDLTPLVGPAVMRDFQRRGGALDSHGIEVCEVSSIFDLVSALLKVSRGSSLYWFNLASHFYFSTQIVQYFLFIKGLTEIKLIGGSLPVERNSAATSVPNQIHGWVRFIVFVLNRAKRFMHRGRTQGYLVLIIYLIQLRSFGILRHFYLAAARFLHRSPLYIETGLAARKIYSELNGASSRVIPSNSFDFDTYLTLKREPVERLVDYRYAVFLDEDMCFHSDFLYCKTVPPATPDIYFPLLKLLFAEIYRRCGLRVVVACHPRARYSRTQREDFFGDAPCFEGETAKLVKDSCFVLAHSSTSLSFAALYMRPVNFLTSNQILQNPQGQFINLIAGEFGSTPINMDLIDASTVFKTKLDWSAKESYVRYVNNYVRHPSADSRLYSFEIIQKALGSYV